MATYAVFCTPGYGHVNPTLALAQELVARGERVIYYLTEDFRPVVEVGFMVEKETLTTKKLRAAVEQMTHDSGFHSSDSTTQLLMLVLALLLRCYQFLLYLLQCGGRNHPSKVDDAVGSLDGFFHLA